MALVREELENLLSTFLTDDILAGSFVRNDGIVYAFLSNEVMITQQAIIPLTSTNNLSKYLHNEINSSSQSPEKLYVYVCGDKHDYLIYPINETDFLVLFVKNFNKDILNALLKNLVDVAVKANSILK